MSLPIEVRAFDKPSARSVDPPLDLRAFRLTPIGRRPRIEERLFDIVIAVGAIVLTSPLLLAVWVASSLSDGGPVLFAQMRIGHRGKPFACYKFRSMVVDAEARLAAVLAENPQARQEWARDHKLRDDPRKTRLGAFLRRSSLDELPQLFNVLRGDMSIVGPRPIVPAEAVRYGRRMSVFWSVRPGITGLWQISGRTDISYRRRVAMDCVYASHKSVARDLGILLLTLPAVLLSRGAC